MRRNLPVTNNEYLLKDGLAIVSKTDTKGKLTYVNPYFIEVSGFSEEELLGSPHNIVRHPDMPPEAFKDLWQTLKAGLPWTGMVKNRRKNGDCYWVMANVTPIRDGSRTVGYMSVRTKPSRAEVAAAEELYRRMREGRARGIAIRRGAVVRTGIPGRLNALWNAGLGVRVALGAGVPAAVLLGLGATAFSLLGPGAAGYGAVGATALGLGACLYLVVNLRASVQRPLRAATAAARAIAGGDMSCRFESVRRDEMGELVC
ncbi:MAG: PAS domain-containing protein, partial [Noviherbaspirillum sp.]